MFCLLTVLFTWTVVGADVGVATVSSNEVDIVQLWWPNRIPGVEQNRRAREHCSQEMLNSCMKFV